MSNTEANLVVVHTLPECGGKEKGGKEVDLYSAFIVVPHTQGTQVRITQLPANYTVLASTS